MSEYAMFYNSENGDRVYDADSFSNWLKKFFTTGVFEGDCQVTALGSMVVNLAPGYANIMGKVKNLENQTFTLEPADGSYPRIDTIVIERNDTDRDITAKLVTGQLSGNDPVPTARVWENGVYQLVVAEIYVAAGATEVTQADITDKRSDPDVCGIVAGTVTEMDFSQFTAQFESYFEQFKASNLEEFDEWFQHMKDQLDTDAAGHLQNEIDAINAKIPSGASASNKLATESEIATINNNLAGFKFYPAGDVDLVALVADDSFYKDENDKYVLADSVTGHELLEDSTTYKRLASAEETHGEVGADTCSPFKGGDKPTLNILSITYLDRQGSAKYTVIKSLDIEVNKIIMIVSQYSTYGNIYKNDVLFTDYENIFIPTSPDYGRDSLIKFNANKGDKIEVTRPQYAQYNCFVLASNTDVELVEKSEITSAGSYTFTASKDYEVLHAFVNRGGYYELSNYSSRLTAHPTIYQDANGGSRIYTFYDVKQGDTITFTAQYNGNSSCCIFAPK